MTEIVTFLTNFALLSDSKPYIAVAPSAISMYDLPLLNGKLF